MLFNSFTFVVFFLGVYLIYRILPHTAQNRLLLVASYVFYGSWDWRFLSLILLSTCVDYVVGHRLYVTEKAAHRKRLLFLSLATNLGMLGIFKYFDFFSGSMQELLRSLGWEADPITLNVVLPVGISFYTFQTLSYTIDIYRKDLKPERNFLDFALFVSFFPQLVAGPIERAKRFLPQIRKQREISRHDVSMGLWLVFFGYFLKVFVADNLATVVNDIYAQSGEVPASEVLIGTYAFAFQIFGDFAGYSSIAIGVARLLGFHLMTNFRFPYFVTNPSDFWRNWHISLSTWLRDYLYIPLGGNRGSAFFTYRNLFLTMLLGGLWHGASWTFVIWGAYQGGVLIVHRLWVNHVPAVAWPRGLQPVVLVAKVVFMFHVTCYGWLIFRASSMDQLVNFTKSLLIDWEWTSKASFDALELGFFTALLLVLLLILKPHGDLSEMRRVHRIVRIPLVVLMFYAMVMFGEYGSSEFIYFQF